MVESDTPAVTSRVRPVGASPQETGARIGHRLEVISSSGDTVIVLLLGYGQDPTEMFKSLYTDQDTSHPHGIACHYLAGFAPGACTEAISTTLKDRFGQKRVILYASSYGASLVPSLIAKLTDGEISVAGMILVAPLLDRLCLTQSYQEHTNRVVAKAFDRQLPANARHHDGATGEELLNTVPHATPQPWVDLLRSVPTSVLLYGGDIVIDERRVRALLPGASEATIVEADASKGNHCPAHPEEFRTTIRRSLDSYTHLPAADTVHATPLS